MKISILADNNFIIKDYGEIENEVNPFKNGIEIDTDLDLDTIDLVNNYKLIDGQLIELTEEEKASLEPVPQPTEIELLKAQLETANRTISLQSDRIKQVETDAITFQDFILETLGGN